jgi:plasmid maintenance system antidote protein VapI
MPRKSRAPAGIDEQLRAAIIASEATHYRLATNAGINPEIVGRFVRGERDIRLATAAKLAAVLGLRLTTG